MSDRGAETSFDVPRLTGESYKGDGETWEAYAHRLERRVKQQRDHINALVALRDAPGDRKARKRIEHLERLLGQKELQLANQHEGLRVLKERLDGSPGAVTPEAVEAARETGS